MAGEERTEQATPKKRKDARDKGQVAKSMELTATLSLLAALATLRLTGDGIVKSWQQFAQAWFLNAGTFQPTAPAMQQHFLHVGVSFLGMVMPILLATMVASVAANMLQVGVLFTSTPLKPDFAKLNLLQGITRMFSQRAFAEMVKSMLKAGLIVYIIVTFFKDRILDDIRLLQSDPSQIMPGIAGLCGDLLMKTGVMMLVIAAADYGFQRWQFEKSIRMTKEEIKEEYKRTEGDPMVKGRIRQKQREMARQRMMAAVPTATVVVTNPTHLAVALRYEPGKMDAPLVVAKGQRLVAARIKEIARTHGVPVVENKPVARALYAACNLGDAIPAELYQAVAEVIAFVFKQSGQGAR